MFIETSLPHSQLSYPDDLATRLGRLATDLTPAFMAAARRAVGMGVLSSDGAIAEGALEDLDGFEGVVDLAVAELTPTDKERQDAAALRVDIDGKNIKYLGRKNMAFRKDERGDLEDYQIGDELYAGNPFDRGHVARRADLCWGTAEEAALVNRDSFYFTNMTPQHERFNQSKLKGLWDLLENAVFDEAEPKNLKVSLLGGPILGRDDPRYSKPDEDLDVQIPTEFWKVVMFADADGKLALRGYILTQADLVKEVVRPETLELEEFRWFQVAIADIGTKTGIRFPARLRAMERLPRPEALANGPPRPRLIQSTADFFA